MAKLNELKAHIEEPVEEESKVGEHEEDKEYPLQRHTLIVIVVLSSDEVHASIGGSASNDQGELLHPVESGREEGLFVVLVHEGTDEYQK
eukprot:CAMPEP_0170561660 /NCGR_PEP_ID=MMETSP0211-20121228/56104_1 /TAXON_ID=311385 /ORGANISM="Pseudokeronopsis sp., Strain OXSARD2" /LENGTH=89 /DNA_ID=CAMNT_0010877479 /DNA_START=426 /DNA_END=695 /DNA_ORIENTATION=+